MSYTGRIAPRASLAERPVACKETLDALVALRNWTQKTQNDPQGETLRAVELAVAGDDRALARKAYGMVAVLKQRVPELTGALEALQDGLMDRMRACERLAR